MANNTIEVVAPGGTVEVVNPVQTQVIEVDAGGRSGPRGPAGPSGTQGPQGVQGRFDLNIFQRAEPPIPTTAPTGGSFNIATGVLTPPTGWFDTPGAATGTGDLIQSRASVDPATETGVVTPQWSIPFEAGGTGPPGESGEDIVIFYADDASGTNATLTYSNQPYAGFVTYTAGTTAPTTPPVGTTWVRIQGDRGATGDSGQALEIFYADDSTGTGATTTYTDQGFVAFVPYTAGTTPPTSPPQGTVWLRFEGPSGLGIPYLTASSIPTIPADLVADTEYHIRVSNLTQTDLPTAVALVIDSISIPSGELDISRGVASGDTAYFTWTPIQATINTLRNNFGSRTALDVVLRFGNPPNRVEVNIVDDVADRLQVNTTYDLSAEGSSTNNAADIRLTGSDSSTDNVTIVGGGGTTVERSGNTITIAGGSGPAPHAQLVPEFSILPTSIQLPIGGTQTVTATATAEIRDGASGDIVNSVEITSAHATLNNGNITINNPNPLTDTSTFTWTVGASQTTATTVTFTCTFTVRYTIASTTMENTFNRTVNLPIVEAPVSFWSGTLTTAQYDSLSSLTDAQVQTALTEMSNFSSPFTSEYNGGSTSGQLHAAIYVPQSVVISSVRSEGFVLEFDSQNISTANRTIYVTRYPLSDGPHNLTWRT